MEDFIVSMSSFFQTFSIKSKQTASIKPFDIIGLFPYPLDTSENVWFSDVFREIKSSDIKWVKCILLIILQVDHSRYSYSYKK